MSEQPEGLGEAIGTDPAVDITNETSGDGAGTESYHGYSVDDEDQPQSTGDSLTDNRGLANPLDEGYSPPEKWSVGQGYGNTPLEEAMGETLDQRLVQEVAEPDPYEEAEAMPVSVIEGELEDEVTEVGDERAGRLVDPQEGVRTDVEGDAICDVPASERLPVSLENDPNDREGHLFCGLRRGPI